MISFRDFIERDRTFAPIEKIKVAACKDLPHRTVDSAMHLRASKVLPERHTDFEMLLIFDTKKQRTWLVANHDALYCVIDNLTEVEPNRVWRIKKDSIISNNEIILPLQIEQNSKATGKITIADKKPRLFSNRLFTDKPIEYRIKIMLMKALDIRAE